MRERRVCSADGLAPAGASHSPPTPASQRARPLVVSVAYLWPSVVTIAGSQTWQVVGSPRQGVPFPSRQSKPGAPHVVVVALP